MAAAPGVEVAAASWPRANGKSWTGAALLARSLTPGDELFVPRAENLLVSGSIEQARVVFRFVREMLGEEGYRYLDSFTRIGVTHKASLTRLRVMSSDAKRALGIVGARLIVGDEPGSWDASKGQRMHDSGQLQARLEQSLAYEAGSSTGSVITVPEGSEPTEAFKANLNDLKGRIGLPTTTSGGDGDGSQSPRRDYQQSRIGPAPPMSLVELRSQVDLCVMSLFGVSPAITMGLSDGTAQRESWRRFLVGVIENLSGLVKAEILLKLGVVVDIDMRGLRALDVSGNARAAASLAAAGVSVDESLRIAGFDNAS